MNALKKKKDVEFNISSSTLLSRKNWIYSKNWKTQSLKLRNNEKMEEKKFSGDAHFSTAYSIKALVFGVVKLQIC